MTAKVLSQVQKKELMVDIIGKLTDIEMNKKSAKNIHNVIVELRQSIEENSHVDFEYYFVQTHPDFYNNLRIDFPNLTPHELRLCAYLKMNLSTKDIAAISNISPDSARTARSRLRKTLKIQNQDENLVSFLAKY
jgi:DNA-binding CsgD family transcriptional regulator